MSKRTLSAAPSSPRKRRAAATSPAADQSRLDAFFRPQPPDAAARDPARPSRAHQGPRLDATSSSAEHHSPSDDEAFARRLAQQDGISMEMLRQLEANIQIQPGPSIIRTPEAVREVIDVDSLEDGQHTGPKSANLVDYPGSSEPPQASGSSGALSSLAAPLSKRNPLLYGDTEVLTAPYPLLDLDLAAYPLETCPWPTASAPYSFLAHALATLSATRSRIAILNTLTNTFRTIIRHHPASLRAALYLLSNSLSPPYSPTELGLGPTIISKAIQDVSGLTPAALKRLYNATGDPGDVAFEAKSNVRTLVPHPPLLINGVYESLVRIAFSKGTGAAKAKQSIVQKLLVAARGEETRYLVRTLGQNLRVGAVRTSILTGLARAAVLTPPVAVSAPSEDLYVSPAQLAEIKPALSNAKKKTVDGARDDLQEKFSRAEALVKKVYVLHPNYDHIADALLDGGLEELTERLPLTVGIPLLPTLGSPVRSLDEVYDQLGGQPFSAEFKYDGQRAQIHAARRSGGEHIVKIFSRHLEDMTDKYPDVVSLVSSIFASSSQAEDFIMDAEIVAIDPADGNLKSFQDLSNRARRDVKLADIKVSVCVYAFDLMYLNKEILLQSPFRQRRSLLRSTFPPLLPEQNTAARFQHVQSCESEDGRDAVEEFWQEAVSSRSEGLMIKLLDGGELVLDSKEGKSRRKPLPATYEPDKRTAAWLKLKKDYVNGLGDSLDLVPIGAWHGNGRKAQWWSPILLATWDPDTGKLVAVCKCMSGFSDAFYKELRERYAEDSDTCARQPRWEPECLTGGLKPEVFFKPQEVWEIKGADVTVSPVSVAALGLISAERGLSLRFPRFIKVREDKGIEHASTPQFLANMYRTQQGDHARGGVDDGDLVDIDMQESEAEEDYNSEDV